RQRVLRAERTSGLAAIDKLEHERPFLDPVDRGDVGMVERREHLRFAGEACETIGVGGEGVGQDFDRDVAIEFGVGGAEDGAHSALAELGGDAVVGDGGRRVHLRKASSQCTITVIGVLLLLFGSVVMRKRWPSGLMSQSGSVKTAAAA